MPDLDDLLSADSGRRMAQRIAHTARSAEPDALAAAGVRRSRRTQLGAVGAVAAAAALIVTVGVTTDGASRTEPAPATSPTAPATTDALEGRVEVLYADVGPVPGAYVLDLRVCDDGCRRVTAATDDDGETWSTLPSGLGTQWLDVEGGLLVRGHLDRAEIVTTDGEVSRVRVGPARPLGEGDRLVYLSSREAAVSTDGTPHALPWDSEGGAAQATVQPTGQIVLAEAGRTRMAPFPNGQSFEVNDTLLRWSDDGGRTWESHETADLGVAPTSYYPFTPVVRSHDPETIAAFEHAEGRSYDVPLGLQYSQDGGATWERQDRPWPDDVRADRPWSVVAPDGTLLSWYEGDGVTGMWRSAGDDWSTLARVGGPGADAGLELAGSLVEDDTLHLFALTNDDRLVTSTDEGATWDDLPMP